MDIAEMVDQLIENKLNDYVNSKMHGRENYVTHELDGALKEIIAERIEKIVHEKKANLIAKVGAYLDTCGVEVDFGGYGGVQVRVIEKKEEK